MDINRIDPDTSQLLLCRTVYIIIGDVSTSTRPALLDSTAVTAVVGYSMVQTCGMSPIEIQTCFGVISASIELSAYHVGRSTSHPQCLPSYSGAVAAIPRYLLIIMPHMTS